MTEFQKEVAIAALLLAFFCAFSGFAAIVPIAAATVGLGLAVPVNPPVMYPIAKVRKITDGDSLRVDLAGVTPLFGHNIPIRLLWIQAAERRSADPAERVMAELCRNRLAELISAASCLQVTACRRDKYFRVLADVLIDGQSASATLVKEGLAVAYHGGKKPTVNWAAMVNKLSM